MWPSRISLRGHRGKLVVNAFQKNACSPRTVMYVSSIRQVECIRRAHRFHHSRQCTGTVHTVCRPAAPIRRTWRGCATVSGSALWYFAARRVSGRHSDAALASAGLCPWLLRKCSADGEHLHARIEPRRTRRRIVRCPALGITPFRATPDERLETGCRKPDSLSEVRQSTSD